MPFLISFLNHAWNICIRIKANPEAYLANFSYIRTLKK